jgi:hypothetical protein
MTDHELDEWEDRLRSVVAVIDPVPEAVLDAARAVTPPISEPGRTTARPQVSNA